MFRSRQGHLFDEPSLRQLESSGDELVLRVVAVFLRDADVDVRKLAECSLGVSLGLARDVAEEEPPIGIHFINRNAGLGRCFLCAFSRRPAVPAANQLDHSIRELVNAVKMLA